MEPSHTHAAVSEVGFIRRRMFFRWLTYGLGAVATVLLAIPSAGYLLGIRKRPVQWVPLGSIDDFPLDQTRLVTFDNPIRQPWDGLAAHIGVYVRHREANRVISWYSLPIALTWVVRFPGFPSQAYSCVLAMAGSIMQLVSEPRVLPHVDFFTASGGYTMASWRFRHRIIQPCTTRWKNWHKGRHGYWVVCLNGPVGRGY